MGDAFKGRRRVVAGSEGRRIEPSPLRGGIGRTPVADVGRLRRKDHAVHPRAAGVVHRDFFADAADSERTVQLARFRVFTVAPDQQKAPRTDGHAVGEGPFGGVIEIVRQVPSAEIQSFRTCVVQLDHIARLREIRVIGEQGIGRDQFVDDQLALGGCGNPRTHQPDDQARCFH